MNGELDLHLHTSASDGKLSPREQVRFVASKGLKQFAITDHDTTLSLEEAKIATQQTSTTSTCSPEIAPEIGQAALV